MYTHIYKREVQDTESTSPSPRRTLEDTSRILCCVPVPPASTPTRPDVPAVWCMVPVLRHVMQLGNLEYVISAGSCRRKPGTYRVHPGDQHIVLSSYILHTDPLEIMFLDILDGRGLLTRHSYSSSISTRVRVQGYTCCHEETT